MFKSIISIHVKSFADEQDTLQAAFLLQDKAFRIDKNTILFYNMILEKDSLLPKEEPLGTGEKKSMHVLSPFMQNEISALWFLHAEGING